SPPPQAQAQKELTVGPVPPQARAIGDQNVFPAVSIDVVPGLGSVPQSGPVEIQVSFPAPPNASQELPSRRNLPRGAHELPLSVQAAGLSLRLDQHPAARIQLGHGEILRHLLFSPKVLPVRLHGPKGVPLLDKDFLRPIPIQILHSHDLGRLRRVNATPIILPLGVLDREAVLRFHNPLALSVPVQIFRADLAAFLSHTEGSKGIPRSGPS